MQKPKSFRPGQPDQTTLLPTSPREWLADDQQVYFLLDLVDELDLSEILAPAQAKDPARLPLAEAARALHFPSARALRVAIDRGRIWTAQAWRRSYALNGAP